MNQSEWLTGDEVEDLTGVPDTTRRRFIAAGKFPAPVPLGLRSSCWTRQDIERYLAEHGRHQGFLGNASAKSTRPVAEFRYPVRFKRESEALTIARFVTALGPLVEKDANGFWTIRVPSHRPDAAAKYLRSQFPHATWERVDVGSTP